MELWLPAVTVVGIYALAVMAPGPNFLVITHSSLVYSRPTGVRTALGVVSGSVLWIVFGFLGVAAVLAHFPTLFSIVKVFGVLYLCFAAIKILWHEFGKMANTNQKAGTVPLAVSHPYRHGFLTQISNPKAALFILALFSTAVSPTTPPALKLVMALAMIACSLSWYLLVANIFALPNFRAVYIRFQKPANIAFAGLLIFLSIKIIF